MNEEGNYSYFFILILFFNKVGKEGRLLNSTTLIFYRVSKVEE